MGEFKPNKSQEAFINAKGQNVLVSASAGSGKTSTMIKKLLQLLSVDKVPITSLLVVTYTNAAAGEIKLKLYNEITKELLAIDDIETKKFLQNQLDNFNNAEIGTLHSICKKLITKYFYEIGESPDFSLLSEGESRYLLESSMSNVFKKYMVNKDDDFFELYDSYNAKRNDSSLKKIITKLIEYKNSKCDFESWKNDFINNSYNVDLDNNTTANYLLNYFKEYFNGFKFDLYQIINECKKCDINKYDNYLSSISQFIDEFSCVTSFVTSIKVLNNFILGAKPQVGRNATVDEKCVDDLVKDFSEEFRSAIKNIESNYVYFDKEKIIASIVGARKNVFKVLSLVCEIEDYYAELKKSRNVLDFNDLENKMLVLLENDKIVDILKKSYQYIFVDEYQDINEKQELILSKIVSDDNYYMIGDVKQSIYAFRQSSPKIFVSKYQGYNNGSLSGRVINFNENYRSSKNILEFANRVFDELITPKTIGIDYKNEARFESSKEFVEPVIDINVIAEDKDSKVDKEVVESIAIANEIKRILSSKKEDGSNFDYKDIAIILRNRGNLVDTLCKTLTSLQIPVNASVRSNFFDTQEIQLLISILRVVSNYKNDIPLVSVLKNLFNFNEDELVEIRLCGEDKPFYDCVKEYPKDDKILIKIKKFYDFLNISKLKLQNCTIAEYLDFVIEQFDILIKEKCMANGTQRESNINSFLALANNESYKYNVDKFMEYIDFISVDDNVQSIGEGGNAVQICTVHYSKGLEYPAVILGALGKEFNLNFQTHNLIINNNFGIGLKSVNNIARTLDETIIRNACKIDNQNGEINEEIRLLYVAMTRAKERLSLVGFYDINSIPKIKHKNIYKLKNPYDMIFKCLTNDEICAFCSKDKFTIGNSGNCANVKIYQSDMFAEKNEQTSEIILNKCNNDLVNSLQRIYSTSPSKETFTIKNTVTNILKDEVDYENVNHIPENLNVGDRALSGDVLKLGTAYHSVMQILKFTENKADIDNIINELIVSKTIDIDVAKLIDSNKIVNAINKIKPLIGNGDTILQEKQFVLRENYNKLVKNSDNNTNVIVQGVIDLVIAKDNNEAVLIDYKTNRTNSEEELIKEYSLQLLIYQKALEKGTNLKVSHKYIYSFFMNKLIEIM